MQAAIIADGPTSEDNARDGSDLKLMPLHLNLILRQPSSEPLAYNSSRFFLRNKAT